MSRNTETKEKPAGVLPPPMLSTVAFQPIIPFPNFVFNMIDKSETCSVYNKIPIDISSILCYDYKGFLPKITIY